ncbi:AsmA family protein [Phaeobacter sp. HF9A]|uniref:AsmA family protein n=1 Tax=Phaeobacter sp. HF9A TaxID=2721561 RepID=UPI001430BB5B|nr:AsmA family protein [Phaeobacter sp. HF9A]NIZ14285.1 AsmA family protein [Phaeobacter sp. HF9A]
MRLIIRILSALLFTLAVAIAIVTFLPGQKLAELVGQQIEKQTGRQVLFGGDVHFSLWPVLGLQANDFALANADWAGPEPLLTAGQLTIGVDAADLIRGKVRITELSAIVPQLNLETREDGTGNWVFETAPNAEATAGASTEESDAGFAIEAVNLSGASLRYAPFGQAPVEMKQVDLSLLWPDPDGTATVDLTLRPAGKPLRVQGEIGSFGDFLAGQAASVGLDVTLPEGKARLDGRADLNGSFEGRVTAESRNTDAVMAALGMTPAGLPQGLGHAITFAADTTYAPEGQLSLRDLSLGLDQNQLAGQADLDLSATPMQITAALRGGLLDLSTLEDRTPGSEGIAPTTASGAGWSSAAIDASGLGMFDGQIGLDLAGLETSSLDLGASKLNIAVERARAVVSLLSVQAFGGTVEGDLVANNRNGLSVAAKLRFADVQLSDALGQLAGYDKLTGLAEGTVDVLGVGNSTDQIMRSLKGSGNIRIGKGFFTGFDLQSIMNPNGGNGGTTVFEALSASYTIADGVLRNDDFLATLKALRAEGAGRVGIGARDLDYTFTPTAFATAEAAGVSVPVRLSGPWSDPKIRPDLSALVQPELDNAEEKAKQAVKDKLSEELGVPVETEEDLNDALKKKVEEEARKQLLKFLGGN